MKISILHPSFKRPQLAKKCYDIWVTNADNLMEIEYVLCLSELDPTLQEYKNIFEGIADITILSENGWVKQLNHAAVHSHGDLLVCIGDDFGCPQHWDTLLLTALQGKEDYIVKTPDGQQPWIMTLPIMDRVYYNRFGYVVYPEYKHMFGDTELTHVADMTGRVINLDILFPHNHYTTGKFVKDEVNIANDSTWAHGEYLYISRMKQNFGIENPKPVQLPQHHIQWLRTKGVIV